MAGDGEFVPSLVALILVCGSYVYGEKLSEG
jgi:hypothetical protein